MELELPSDRHYVKSVGGYVRGLYSNAGNNVSEEHVRCQKTEDYNAFIGILIGAMGFSSGNPYASVFGVILGVAALYGAYKARCPFL